MFPVDVSGRPPGDPAAMAAAARKLVALAARVNGLDASVAQALPASAFTSPNRSGVDAKIRNASLRCTRAGSDLLALAKTLAHEAQVVQRAQKAYDDAKAREARSAKPKAGGRR